MIKEVRLFYERGGEEVEITGGVKGSLRRVKESGNTKREGPTSQGDYRNTRERKIGGRRKKMGALMGSLNTCAFWRRKKFLFRWSDHAIIID